MADDRKSEDASDDRTYSARNVRQADIVLRRRWQRIFFIGGLVALALIAVAAALLR